MAKYDIILNVALKYKKAKNYVAALLRKGQSSLTPLESLFIYTCKRAKYPKCAMSHILADLLLAPGLRFHNAWYKVSSILDFISCQ
jgi:hypothetical protein